MFCRAHTSYGVIGVKCWVYQGENVPSADRKKWSRWRRPTKAQRIIRWKGVRDNDDVNAKESEVPETTARAAQGQGLARGELSFGEYGLKALEPAWITDRQIEASRVAITRFIKRGGKLWIRIFPDKPFTKKPAETRMGKGKARRKNGWRS